MWENYLISERMKYLSYNEIHCNRYFWRTHSQQEIDYIEERNGAIAAYEFKWNKKSARFPKSFINAYSPSEIIVVSKENVDSFIRPEG